MRFCFTQGPRAVKGRLMTQTKYLSAFRSAFRYAGVAGAVIALGGVGAAVAAGGGASSGAGGGIGGHDSSAPVNYAADRIELQDKQNRVLLSGNVDITQENLSLKADSTLVDYTNEGGLKIHRIDALGHVRIVRGAESAVADVANYDFDRRIITLVGNVVLQRGADVSRGGRLVIDLNAHQSGFVGGAGGNGQAGRVVGSFSVGK